VATITLSYTFFEVGGSMPAAPQPTAAVTTHNAPGARS
jgi:cytochrome c oxidase assembly protein Cox11